MLRLTILYNLTPDADEKEFVRWRLTEQQESNASLPDVVHTDFTRLDESWPKDAPPPYRFMTTVDWPDRESFEKAFYDPEEQATFQESLQQLGNYMVIVGEVLIAQTND